MSVPDVEQIETRERTILDRAPFEAEHVSDAETQAYDARLLQPFTPNQSVGVSGRIRVSAGTILELKTCQCWYDDPHSRGGRRRGQFKVNRDAHEELCELGGLYAALVLDGEEILGGRFVEPAAVGDASTWYNGGRKYATDRATIPWPKLVPKSLVRGGGSPDDV